MVLLVCLFLLMNLIFSWSFHLRWQILWNLRTGLTLLTIKATILRSVRYSEHGRLQEYWAVFEYDVRACGWRLSSWTTPIAKDLLSIFFPGFGIKICTRSLLELDNIDVMWVGICGHVIEFRKNRGFQSMKYRRVQSITPGSLPL